MAHSHHLAGTTHIACRCHLNVKQSIHAFFTALMDINWLVHGCRYHLVFSSLHSCVSTGWFNYIPQILPDFSTAHPCIFLHHSYLSTGWYRDILEISPDFPTVYPYIVDYKYQCSKSIHVMINVVRLYMNFNENCNLMSGVTNLKEEETFKQLVSLELG